MLSLGVVSKHNCGTMVHSSGRRMPTDDQALISTPALVAASKQQSGQIWDSTAFIIHNAGDGYLQLSHMWVIMPFCDSVVKQYHLRQKTAQ